MLKLNSQIARILSKTLNNEVTVFKKANYFVFHSISLSNNLYNLKRYCLLNLLLSFVFHSLFFLAKLKVKVLL